jgi:Crinkler effector protein N-terminal domain
MADDNSYKLWCWAFGESHTHSFPVRISKTYTVGELKEMIKAKKMAYRDIDASSLVLWRVAIDIEHLDSTLGALKNPCDVAGSVQLSTFDAIEEAFPDAPKPKFLHIIVQREGESRCGRLNCYISFVLMC